MPVDGHNVSSAGHPVNQYREMPMIDVNAIWLENFFDLIEEASSSSLNSENFINFNQIVCGCLLRIDVWIR